LDDINIGSSQHSCLNCVILFHQNLNAKGKLLKKYYLGRNFFENMEKEQVVYEKDTFSLLLFIGKFDL
jgi:hypothetical protein